MKVLVVGAGISGLATAISLSRIGADVDIVERTAHVETLGSGITLIAPAVRALHQLGVYDDCLAQGYGISDFETYDAGGALVSSFRLPSPIGTEQPGMLGMMRPVLHRILLDHASRRGVNVRVATSLTRVEQDSDTVTVTFDNGESNAYDIVVGADGVRSTVRDLVFGSIKPTFAGQGTLRIVLPRPADVTAEIQFHNVGDVFVGFTPTGPNEMYMYCSFPVEEEDRPEASGIVELARSKTASFGGLVARIRDEIRDPGQINFTKFGTILAPAPWCHGRVVLVGDAAHCPTPQLAAGAAMCLEDAVALAEELDRAASPEIGLQAFSVRRFERCKYMVETAILLSYWQTHPGTPGSDHEGVTAEAFRQLAGTY